MVPKVGSQGVRVAAVELRARREASLLEAASTLEGSFAFWAIDNHHFDLAVKSSRKQDYL